MFKVKREDIWGKSASRWLQVTGVKPSRQAGRHCSSVLREKTRRLNGIARKVQPQFPFTSPHNATLPKLFFWEGHQTAVCKPTKAGGQAGQGLPVRTFGCCLGPSKSWPGWLRPKINPALSDSKEPSPPSRLDTSTAACTLVRPNPRLHCNALLSPARALHIRLSKSPLCRLGF